MQMSAFFSPLFHKVKNWTSGNGSPEKAIEKLIIFLTKYNLFP